MTFKELYTDLILKNADRLKSVKPNQIFVIQGQVNLINTDTVTNFLADPETFYIESDEMTFNKAWFAKIFTILQQTKCQNPHFVGPPECVGPPEWRTASL